MRPWTPVLAGVVAVAVAASPAPAAERRGAVSSVRVTAARGVEVTIAAAATPWQMVAAAIPGPVRVYARSVNRRAYDPAGHAVAGVAVVAGGSHRRCAPGVTCVESTTFVPAAADAFTIGHTVIARVPVRGALLRHELVHVRQYERHGWTFLLRYAWSSFKCWGYSCNRFERAARVAGRR